MPAFGVVLNGACTRCAATGVNTTTPRSKAIEKQAKIMEDEVLEASRKARAMMVGEYHAGWRERRSSSEASNDNNNERSIEGSKERRQTGVAAAAASRLSRSDRSLSNRNTGVQLATQPRPKP